MKNIIALGIFTLSFSVFAGVEDGTGEPASGSSSSNSSSSESSQLAYCESTVQSIQSLTDEEKDSLIKLCVSLETPNT